MGKTLTKLTVSTPSCCREASFSSPLSHLSLRGAFWDFFLCFFFFLSGMVSKIRIVLTVVLDPLCGVVEVVFVVGVVAAAAEDVAVVVVRHLGANRCRASTSCSVVNRSFCHNGVAVRSLSVTTSIS